MASESTEEDAVQVTLPEDLGAWLEDRAIEQDTDPERLLVDLLAAYRATVDLDAEADGTKLAVTLATGESIEDYVSAAVETALAEELSTTRAEVRWDLADRMEELQSEFDQKIEDVRQRLVQVKLETDAKAPKEHQHADVEAVEGLPNRLRQLEAAIERLRENLVDLAEEDEAPDEDLAERLDEVEERLRTVAWVCSDLREAHESGGGGSPAVDCIKHEGAELDVERARCENCGAGVHLGLLTEPACPHCDATVTSVEAGNGFFGKPRLLVASQLDSGE